MTFLDHVTTSLNACSLESLAEPIAVQYTNDGEHASALAWPVMVGCYELDQESGERKGCLALHMVEHPHANTNAKNAHANARDSEAREEKRTSMSNSELTFGDPYLTHHQQQQQQQQQQHDEEAEENKDKAFSGVLDGKWCPLDKNNTCSESESESNTHTSTNTERTKWLYAAARASGEISFHELSTATQEKEKDMTNRSNERIPFQLRQVGSSSANDNDNALCLSVNWDTTTTFSGNNVPTESHNSRRRSIVSSYSNGQVVIHDVTFPQNSGNCDSPTVHVQERHRWNAHSLFGKIPTEVWTACFANNGNGNGNDNRIVLSGGDDGICKLWDLRSSTCRPAHTLADFDAGVTVVSPHPRKDHIVAIGSYDEHVAICDVRYPSKPLRKCSCDGGIWRLQWHPIENDRLLVAAMHSGCRVLQVETRHETDNDNDNQYNTDSDNPNARKHQGSELSRYLSVTKKFTEHKSMAYGADWLVSRHDHGYYEAAASCSFYDRAAFLWDTV